MLIFLKFPGNINTHPIVTMKNITNANEQLQFISGNKQVFQAGIHLSERF